MTNTKGKSTGSSERLSVLTDGEKEAIYGRPDFDEEQQLKYLALTETELSIVNSRPNIQARVYCLLQIGYFKAKHSFFQFEWDDIADDYNFVLNRYFPHEKSLFNHGTITKHELYTQREQIIQLFGYSPWSANYLPSLRQQTKLIVRRDITPGFVATELFVYLNEQKIIRPGYTTLQELISTALTFERKRLGKRLDEVLDASHVLLLNQLLNRDDTLSQLAVLRQDASNFGWRQMALEREKRSTLAPLYQVAKDLLPKLKVSHQNLLYYADLVNFYTIHDLRHLKAEQTRLYLICYAWVRYKQFTDNLVEAMLYHMKKLGDESRTAAKQLVIDEKVKRHQETPQVGQLLSLYLDDGVADLAPFGEVRQQAYKIMPKDLLQSTVHRMNVKPLSKLALRWQAIDTLAGRIRRHLRPLFVVLEFGCTVAHSPWFSALEWVKSIFFKQKRLSHRALEECPTDIIPKHLRPYLLIFDADGAPISLHADRYEFWLYHQIRKRFQSGEFYLDDSLQHRCLSDDLVLISKQKDVLTQMKLPFLEQPIDTQLDKLESELHKQWQAFNRELKQGKLTHLEYDKEKQKLTWRKPRQENQKDDEQSFYGKLPFCDIADVLRFVNDECQFLSAFIPLQPRYAKKEPDINSLLAVIIAQAMNHGNHVLARTSDIPYHVLDNCYQQYLRHATLHHANDRISDAIGLLPIFPHYSLDLSALYGAVDGQKFAVQHPTLKARYSRKHFGRGKGVAAYTLLCNHIPLNGCLISNHDYEAHHVFDIWYRNTSKITSK
ncbi:Tn3 family transposase, partial [Aliivibrio sifiae]